MSTAPIVISALGRNLVFPTTRGRHSNPNGEISPSTRNDKMELMIANLGQAPSVQTSV